MATRIQHFLLLSSLALCVLSVEVQAGQNLPTVQIINSLTPNSPKVTLRVASGNNIYLGEHHLSVDEIYKFKVEQEKKYYCVVEWQQYFTSWPCFELPRDHNQEFLYWLMKKEGIYRWEKADWVLESPWKTD